MVLVVQSVFTSDVLQANGAQLVGGEAAPSALNEQ